VTQRQGILHRQRWEWIPMLVLDNRTIQYHTKKFVRSVTLSPCEGSMFTRYCNAKGMTGTITAYKKISCPFDEKSLSKVWWKNKEHRTVKTAAVTVTMMNDLELRYFNSHGGRWWLLPGDHRNWQEVNIELGSIKVSEETL